MYGINPNNLKKNRHDTKVELESGNRNSSMTKNPFTSNLKLYQENLSSLGFSNAEIERDSNKIWKLMTPNNQ